MGIFQKIFGTRSERAVKQISGLVDAVLALEAEYAAMSEEELQGQTAIFKEKLAANPGLDLEELLPRAFATVREAAWRVLGMKHYPVQIIGGIILHQGRIAEMKTGEGKTLVATLPAYLNALTGKGVHVVTVNDYLARRDSEWMGKIYRYLGLSVGLVVPGMKPEEKKESYACDITYGTGNEFGFDYLRDNMVTYTELLMQRGHNFTIVDEVDSILIDEARTPLIISGMQTGAGSPYYEMCDSFVKGLKSFRIVSTAGKADYDTFAKTEEYDPLRMGEFLTEAQHTQLKNADYIVDEKSKHVMLTASGISKAEANFNIDNLAAVENMTLSHHINQALRAHGIMKRDVDYIKTDDGKILIVDEFTGRVMQGRRFSHGLHQAIEAKEKVKVESENQTSATITLQNYFRMYKKMSGMTGTAMTEQAEFEAIYSLDVVEIPPNKPSIRQDLPDLMYHTRAGKYKAVLEQIKACHAKGQPVLVGTISVEISEMLSKQLKAEGIPHNILNAKHHEKEAMIVAQAGKLGAVTVATNMAGRGTDIKLGGNAEFLAEDEMRAQGFEDALINEATGYAETDNEEILAARETYQQLLKKYQAEVDEEAKKVIAAGGLYILGTERHESRRIDNQLRGRAGRQGDPGTTRFYLSTEDELLRLFAGDRMNATLSALKVSEDMQLESAMFTSIVEKAQAKVEGMHFSGRKHVLEYDNVIDKQRDIIYEQRAQVLANADLRETIRKMLPEVAERLVTEVLMDNVEVENAWDDQVKNRDELGKRTEITLMDVRQLESSAAFMLQGKTLPTDERTLYGLTPEDLADLLVERAEELYAAKEQEYPDFIREMERTSMLRAVDENWVQHIGELDELKRSIGLVSYGQKDPLVEFRIQSFDMFDDMVANIKRDTVNFLLTMRLRTNEEILREQVIKEVGTNGPGDAAPAKKVPVRVGKKVGPNEPCPCGSGKKYKKCCGQR